jgi:hypothetical protein
MKALPGSLKIVVLAAVGIGITLAVVSFAQSKPAPAPGSYVLLLKDNVPVADKTKFEAALRKHTKDKAKWKDESGKDSDVPSNASNAPRAEEIQTAQIKAFDSAERARLTAIGVHVTQQLSFNTAAALKAVVDTLQ